MSQRTCLTVLDYEALCAEYSNRLIVLQFSTHACVRCPAVTNCLTEIEDRYGFVLLTSHRSGARPEVFDHFGLAFVPAIAIIPPRAWMLDTTEQMDIHAVSATDEGCAGQLAFLYQNIDEARVEPLIEEVLKAKFGGAYVRAMREGSVRLLDDGSSALKTCDDF